MDTKEKDTAPKAPSTPAPPAVPNPPTEAPDSLAGLQAGRIVYYWPHFYESGHEDAAGPWPAMVTHVEERAPTKGRVTLNVNMPAPAPIGTDPVQRRPGVPFASEPTPGHWTWPPR